MEGKKGKKDADFSLIVLSGKRGRGISAQEEEGAGSLGGGKGACRILSAGKRKFGTGGEFRRGDKFSFLFYLSGKGGEGERGEFLFHFQL